MNDKWFFNLEVSPSSGPNLLKLLEAPVIIYGAGNFGKEVSRCLIQHGIQVIAFLDRRATFGSHWEGVPIYPPDWQDISPSQKKAATIIIAIHNREVEIPPITMNLRFVGYRHFIQPVELYDIFSEQLANHYWLTSRSLYKSWQSEIEDGLSLWEDASSRIIYIKLIEHRISGNPEILPEPDLTHQYFPIDIPAWFTPIRYIDCGAFDGNTLHIAQNLDLEIENSVLFEPDPVNFKKLSLFIRNDWKSPAFCLPCGVFSSTDQMHFAMEGGEGGRLTDSSDNIIQVVALDDILYGFNPNLIKMDIEGAEFEALLGAKQLIMENRPGLAICVYHHPCHLWKIPLLVKKWNLNYQFYLRSHGYNQFDTVMYAIPGEI